MNTHSNCPVPTYLGLRRQREVYKSEMIITTVVTSNHLPRARVLFNSVKKHYPHAKFIVCLVERNLDASNDLYIGFDDVVLVKDLHKGNFAQLIFKYDQMEACCYAKAPLFNYAFNKYPDEQHVLFLDSDTEIFAPLDDLAERFERSSIILSPQHLKQGAEYDDFYNGVYNAGLIGVSRTQSGIAFVNWWTKRLERHACFTPYNTLFAEQKWLNLVPSFFEGVEIIKHPGYNIAGWNYGEQHFTRSDDGRYLVNGEPLYVMHFHAISEREKELIKSHFQTEYPIINELIKDYAFKLDAAARHQSDHIPWSYNFFRSGNYINTKSREVYRNNLYLEQQYPNPFKLNNIFFKKYDPDKQDKIKDKHMKSNSIKKNSLSVRKLSDETAQIRKKVRCKLAVQTTRVKEKALKKLSSKTKRIKKKTKKNSKID